MAMGQRRQQSADAVAAAESGARVGQARRNLAENARQFDESVNQQELDRWQRQWEDRRRSRLAERELDIREKAAGLSPEKARTTNFGAGRTQWQMDQEAANQVTQREQFQEGQRQFDEQLDLKAAAEGLQRGGGGGAMSAGMDPTGREQAGVAAALQQNPNDPRLQQLMAEMQRGSEQMGMGVESAGGRKWVPTPEGMQDREIKRTHAQAARMNAANRMIELQTKATALQAKLDGATGAQREEFEKDIQAVSKEIVNGDPETRRWGLANMVNALNAMDKGKATKEQWARLAEEVGGVQAVGGMAEIQREIATQQIGPAIRRFLNEGINKSIIEHMARVVGRMPAGFEANWDPSTAAARTFQANSESVAKSLKAGISAQLYPVTEQSQWARMVRQNAALWTLNGLGMSTGQPMGAGGAGQAPAPGGESMPRGTQPTGADPRELGRRMEERGLRRPLPPGSPKWQVTD